MAQSNLHPRPPGRPSLPARSPAGQSHPLRLWQVVAQSRGTVQAWKTLFSSRGMLCLSETPACKIE